MIERRVLVTGTFPIERPSHGGQKRTRAIVDAYARAFSHVQYLAVFDDRHYPHATPVDVRLPAPLVERSIARPLTEDVIIGHAIWEDETVRTRVAAFLREFRPDIVHLETPYTWIGLKPLLAAEGLAPRIVFGSENIEAPLRESVMERFGVDAGLIAETVAEIAELEARLSVEADLVAACTVSDLNAHRELGAAATVLAPNGMEPLAPSPEAVAAWRARFAADGVDRIATFVGSAHVPNINGFETMIGLGLGFLAADERIVFAGSIGGHVEHLVGPEDASIEGATFWLRGVVAGQLPEAELQGLIGVSDVLLLPLVFGGGSNLKTAEAILADTRVVCTPTALRGFEWFAGFPNTWVVQEGDRPGFHAAIREAFRTPLVPRTAEQREQARSVTWERCLAPLVEAVATL
ncbi:MAG: hypothetical protein J7480_07970 [Microbacteriaceae bacterium]|nr:hypothetical protein [Microbacteriaceae bacterium]